MDADRFVERTGPPDMMLAGLQLWVHGREFPETVEPYDLDWLRTTVHCGAAGATVWVTGTFLGSYALWRWMTECQRFYDTLAGGAALHSDEPDFEAGLTDLGGGRLELVVRLTPDYLNQKHQFSFKIDQSYLPPMLAQCRQILAAYPVPKEFVAREA